MKKLVLVIYALSCLTNVMTAQSSIGVHIGPSFSKMRIEGDADILKQSQNFTGVRAGLNYQYKLNPAFNLESGIYYNLTGFSIKQGTDFSIYGIDVPVSVTATTQMHFIEIPLLMNVNFGNDYAKFYIHAGPQFSYAMDADLRLRAKLLLDFNLGTYDINMRNNNFRQAEISGLIGGGLKAKLSDKLDFNLGIDYMHGFTDLTDEPIVNVLTKRSVVNTAIGFTYKF
ncbi:MAG: PorT family protein [Saprospiraceae bacterium]|nr:PorT family protein [Saprospiraceae bacterium]